VLRGNKIGFVFQSYQLVPTLTARENILLPAELVGLAGDVESRADELLERVGLEARGHHYPIQLSGGEQQRVAIAVALANRPELLLADEPTGELDSGTAKMIFDIFHGLNQSYGLTVVIVSHDPQIAHHVARVVAIRDGKTSSETLRRPAQTAASNGVAATEAEHQLIEYTVLDPAGRMQVPEEYRERYGIGRRAILEALPDGIVIRPIPGERHVVKPLVENDEPPPPRPTFWGRMQKVFRKQREVQA
jgi:ABC-type multidrug transport system ATPase subunit